MKLWAGRLAGDVDETLNALNASISFDSRMIFQDIRGSIAHARMLGKVGVLSAEDSERIISGLNAIAGDLHSGALKIDMTMEDVHTFVEAELTRRIGSAGKRLHTGRSRNDQVALDLRLYLSDALDEVIALCGKLSDALKTAAKQHEQTIMPGYTHLQRAQPVTLAKHLGAYVQMLSRDIARFEDCKERTLVSPLGSGALAGVPYPIDRAMTAAELGMHGFCENTMDGVSDRDFAIEALADLSILMMHLSRLAEEICLWCSWEFRFMSLSDRFSTGSSIMPQKKNPDSAELIRGKSGRVYGDLIALLVAMKGLPLAYNKDMQEDKEALFDALDTATACLKVLAPMIETAEFYPANMLSAAKGGYINATRCADYLVSKGLPFRDAYSITGQLVNRCIELGVALDDLPLEEYLKFSDLFDSDVYKALSLTENAPK